MNITFAKFESITDEAFSFLISEFGYSAKPPRRGGRFNTALVREFVKGDLKIKSIFGDADSSELCSIVFDSIVFDDAISAKVRRLHMQRALSVLLKDRFPHYRHKTDNDLSDENALADIVSEYGRLLRDHGADVVEGDFSAFPTIVHLLVYIPDRQKPDIGRPIGILSSPDLAEKAIANRHHQIGKHEELEGYEVWSLDIDPVRLIRPKDFGLPGI